MTSVTRSYSFSASHRLHATELSEAENAAVFGKCNNPYGHGHNYVLSVTVEGPVDPRTGLIIDMQTLDCMVEELILRVFAHRNLNFDLAYFAHTIPTTENVVKVIAEVLDTQWTTWFRENTAARLARIHVQETERNGFEVAIKPRQNRRRLSIATESITVNV